MRFISRFCSCFFGEFEIWFSIWVSLKTEFSCIVHHVLKEGGVAENARVYRVGLLCGNGVRTRAASSPNFLWSLPGQERRIAEEWQVHSLRI